MKKKIIVFGAGGTGARTIHETSGAVVAVWDNDASKAGSVFCGFIVTHPLESVKEINYEYDAVIIAVRDWQPQRVKMFNDMNQQLLSIGIPPEKIAAAKGYSLKNPRVCFLRHLSEQIYENNIEGAVAECGVYRGHFAQFLHEYFPDRPLYLFDTFEGFNDGDVETEFTVNTKFNALYKGTSSKFAHRPKFKMGSIDVVRKRTQFASNVIIRQGYVPDTFDGLEDERFAFVNLDLDLYAPQLAGLRFFFERMSAGGVILLHDYFSPLRLGVKKAVDEFAIERRFMRLPIGDGSSIALMKY